MALALPRRTPAATVAVMLAGVLVAWLISIREMSGMDAGPGTDLGTLGWYVGVWVTMMAAMMLPSVLPMVLLYDRMARERGGRLPAPSTIVFTAAYLAVWTVYGLGAWSIYRLVADRHIGVREWSR